MDIVVKGLNVEVPEHYRVHVTEKLGRLERYDKKLVRFDVELFHEPNRRQLKSCQRVEITTSIRGQAVRAEASAGDFYAALDCAASKLENRLRRMHDRRRVHHGRHSPASIGVVVAGGLPEVPPFPAEFDARTNGQPVLARTALLEAEPYQGNSEESGTSARVPQPRGNVDNDELDEADDTEDYRPGRIVRSKQHPAKPMKVDQALSEMELVGHDFYLFQDADCGQPSVVYRRKGFDYGVIRLA